MGEDDQNATNLDENEVLSTQPDFYPLQLADKANNISNLPLSLRLKESKQTRTIESYRNYEKIWQDIEDKTEKEINFKYLVKKSNDPAKAIKEKLRAKLCELFIRHKMPT